MQRSLAKAIPHDGTGDRDTLMTDPNDLHFLGVAAYIIPSPKCEETVTYFYSKEQGKDEGILLI